MNKEYAAPYSNAFLNVMPQLGLTDVKMVNEEECDRKITAPGVIVIIGILGDIHGNVIFGMSEDTAKKIASTMMGMDVEEFDEITQSAVSELGNMLAATACTDFAQQGIKADISTPTLMYGDFNANASFDRVIRIDMLTEELPFCIYVSLEKI